MSQQTTTLAIAPAQHNDDGNIIEVVAVVALTPELLALCMRARDSTDRLRQAVSDEEASTPGVQHFVDIETLLADPSVRSLTRILPTVRDEDVFATRFVTRDGGAVAALDALEAERALLDANDDTVADDVDVEDFVVSRCFLNVTVEHNDGNACKCKVSLKAMGQALSGVPAESLVNIPA